MRVQFPTGWPVTLVDGDVKLRPMRTSDENRWMSLRRSDADWLTKWDATSPHPVEMRAPSFRKFVRLMAKQANEGTSLPFAVCFHDRLVGQLTVASIQRGSLWSGTIGYWIAREAAGRGVIPTGVALATDYCFSELGLHRIEINIRPENGPSLRVVEKLGFRDEGLRVRYLHIQGQWADHRTFALTSEEVPEGLMTRWRRSS